MTKGALVNTNGRIAIRDSNIELLRIFAMVFIVLGHLMGHGGIVQAGNMTNLLWGGVLVPGGKIGYDCFVIITAWFCSGKDFKGSRLLNIALEAVFYNLVGMALTTTFNNGLIEPITIRNWIGCFSPIFGISQGFAVYYMVFLIILPLLNAVSEKMSKRNIVAIIILLFLMQIWWKVFSVIIGYTLIIDLDNGLFTFIILYFAVVYIKKWPLKIIKHKSLLIFSFYIIWLLIAATNIIAIRYPNISIFSLSIRVLNDDISPLNMIASFSLFFLFKELNIKHSNLINFVASHTFGILLLHDHNYFRYVIWKRVFFVENFYDAKLPILIAYTAFVVLAVFAVGIIVDTIREYLLEKPIQRTNIYSKVCYSLENCFKL